MSKSEEIAERQAKAKELGDMEKSRGSQSQLAGRDSSGGSIVKPPETITDRPKTLSDLGINKTQSSRYQALANILH